MIDDEYLVSSCERTSEIFQTFSQDMTLATNTIGKAIQINGSSRELELLYIQLNKLLISQLKFRGEYLQVIIEATADPEVKSVLESAREENTDTISETLSRLEKFQ